VNGMLATDDRVSESRRCDGQPMISTIVREPLGLGITDDDLCTGTRYEKKGMSLDLGLGRLALRCCRRVRNIRRARTLVAENQASTGR